VCGNARSEGARSLEGTFRKDQPEKKAKGGKKTPHLRGPPTQSIPKNEKERGSEDLRVRTRRLGVMPVGRGSKRRVEGPGRGAYKINSQTQGSTGQSLQGPSEKAVTGKFSG